MPSKKPVNVIALTSSNLERNLTLRLRVLLMLPFLSANGYEVEIIQLESSRKKRVEQLGKLPHADLIWIHRHIFSWRELQKLKRLRAKRVFDHDDPVGFSSSNFANLAPKKWLRYQLTVRSSSAVIAASPGLVKLANPKKGNVYHIPLCAEPNQYSLKTNPRLENETFRLLWIGGHSTFKYLEYCVPMLEAIGKAIDNIELIVVGHSKLTLESLKVVNIQWSPEQEREQFTRCHVGLVPTTNDRWTRAKATLKPLQYMASGLPFIAPPVGVLVDFADNGKNGLLATNVQEWVAAIEKLKNNESLRITMGENGINYVKAHHSVEVLAPKVLQVFESVLKHTA